MDSKNMASILQVVQVNLIEIKKKKKKTYPCQGLNASVSNLLKPKL